MVCRNASHGTLAATKNDSMMNLHLNDERNVRFKCRSPFVWRWMWFVISFRTLQRRSDKLVQFLWHSVCAHRFYTLPICTNIFISPFICRTFVSARHLIYCLPFLSFSPLVSATLYNECANSFKRFLSNAGQAAFIDWHRTVPASPNSYRYENFWVCAICAMHKHGPSTNSNNNMQQETAISFGISFCHAPALTSQQQKKKQKVVQLYRVQYELHDQRPA